MASITASVEVEIGPVCRAGLDVLDLVKEVLPYVADETTRHELSERASGLIDLMESTLKGRANG